MCGIVAVLSRPSRRPAPSRDAILAKLQQAAATLDALRDSERLVDKLERAAGLLSAVDEALGGTAGVRALVSDEALAVTARQLGTHLSDALQEFEEELDRGEFSVPPADLEAVNAAVVRVKDGIWAVLRERLRTATAVAELAALGPSGPLSGDRSLDAVDGYFAIQLALSTIDRLEVRGRDSAGLHVLVAGAEIDPTTPNMKDALATRADPLFESGSVRVADGCFGFVYKAAAEIGELGDNTAVLRAAIAADDLLRTALSQPDARVLVLGHTRWASVGVISEPNAHPLNSDEIGDERVGANTYVLAALNGDVDNFAELRAADGLRIAEEITTDAKVIPTLVARRIEEGVDLADAFRTTVARFEGSVAIGACSATEPDRILLALRGSGQALYVGVAEDAFVVASEPYGLVEVTPTYLRMDGDRTSGTTDTRGQVIVLDRAHAGTTAGITRVAYDGTPLPVADIEYQTAEITTRDIDRAGAPHFLLKELGESPLSVRKTIRGKLEDRKGLLGVRLPAGVLPEGVAARLASGEIRRVIATGQGTAAIASIAVARSMTDALSSTPVQIEAMAAAELSGFRLVDDMRDTIVVAVSQSGTSADTNRTVDLVRARGATVIAIVNRRNSDLVDKSDGVLYTSDGRDVEMAVPSTKAFYAQVAAGIVLAWGLAADAGVDDRHRGAGVLDALRRLPDAMDEVLRRREDIAAVAQRHAPSRRYWAVVGNGPNRIAAQELRIKMSELCYKSIAFDITEEKKHIDLSAEPLIFVCAAGLEPAIADDVAKEVAIFRAHKALPLVVANDGERRFDAAVEVMTVPAVHPELDFVLSTMVGHLFGYEAAVAIDAQARQLRHVRGVVESAITAGEATDDVLARVAVSLEGPVARFFSDLRAGAFNGNLEASTAVRVASLLRYARGLVPLEVYEQEYGRVGSPDAVLGDLLAALNQAIDELTRPIDAIKHQAKTVTVGTSRAEETYADIALVGELLASGAGRDRVGYRALRTVAHLDPAVVRVTGYSRYAVDGDVGAGTATIHRFDSGGVARSGVADRRRPGVERHKTARRVRTGSDGEPRRARRSDDHHRARDQGQPGHRDHAASCRLRRPSGRRGRAPRAHRVSQPVCGDRRCGDRDRAGVRRLDLGACGARRSAGRAGLRAGQPLARPTDVMTA